MRIKRLSMLLLVAPLFLSGCAVHSPLLGYNRTVVSRPNGKQYAPHENKVFVSEDTVPSEVEYEMACQIDVGKVWWGGSDWVMNDMAQKARSLGVDAVVEVKVWKQPSGWAWAAPHGVGKAIKLTGSSSTNHFSSMRGVWR